MARVAIRFGLGPIVTTGITAGIIFAVLEVFAAAMLMGVEAAVMPLTMIGAIVIGSAALDAGYPPEIAATTGVIVHMTLSVAFAGVFRNARSVAGRHQDMSTHASPGTLFAAQVSRPGDMSCLRSER